MAERSAGRVSRNSFAFRSIQTTLNKSSVEAPIQIEDELSELNLKSGIREWDRGKTTQTIDLNRNVPSKVTFDSVKEMYESLDDGRSVGQIASSVVKYSQSIGDNFTVWKDLVDIIFSEAIYKGYVYIDLAVQISLKIIENNYFQNAAYKTLTEILKEMLSSKSGRREVINSCELCSKLLLSNWPAMFDNCAKECNMLLFVVLSAVQGWLSCIKNTSSASLEESCCRCLILFANSSGRKLWMKWPELVDGIYSAIKPIVVGNEVKIRTETKERLLDLYVKLHVWAKPVNKPNTKCSSTQTESLETVDTACQHEALAFSVSPIPQPLISPISPYSTPDYHRQGYSVGRGWNFNPPSTESFQIGVWNTNETK